MGFVLHEAFQCWYLQWLEVWGAHPCGCCCVDPLELLGGEGWDGMG